MRPTARDRLDRVLVRRGLAPTRARAQALVMAGRVVSSGLRMEKPGAAVAPDIPLEVLPGRRFVSRGGEKLDGAIDRFDIEVEGRDAMDVGASTGGFTDVLLGRGASRVVALDVGRGQLDWGLRNDERVHVIEGLNARYLKPEDLPFLPVLAVVDVSFISLELVLPAVARSLDAQGDIVALVKPQFEVGRREVGKRGIVRDPALHRRVLQRIVHFAGSFEWHARGLFASPIRGAEGNREFFVHLLPDSRGAYEPLPDEALEDVTSALEEPQA